MNKNFSAQIKYSLVILLFFAGLFLTGTFCDKAVAETLFNPDYTIVKLITTIGIYPFYAVQTLFWGAIFERVIHSEKSSQLKSVQCTICILSMLFMGFVGSRSLTAQNSLGSIFPSFTDNIPIIILLSLIFEYPLFFVGYFCARKTDDKLLEQRIAGLFIVMLFAFISMRVLKNFFDRPRYRTVVLGYDGITFVPWYTPFSGAEKYASAYGLSADEFRSFPSGHSIFSVLTMCIFPSLTWIFPKLKSKYIPLFFVGFVFGVIVMVTRMILGAHYLSDTSAGAVIGVLSSAAFGAIQLRISKNAQNRL